MMKRKKAHLTKKAGLHPRNKHTGRYDFKQLIASCPDLKAFVSTNKFGDDSIDFFDSESVRILNKALLAHFYDVKGWSIPANYLCPPIPGRADYIHYVADLLKESNEGVLPTGNKIVCLDVGVGASCVYPIIGYQEYGWSFIGSDIDPVSVKSSKEIVEVNAFLKGNVDVRLQRNSNTFFKGVLRKNECITVSVCNPPFHASLAEAKEGTLRKLSNLKKQKVTKTNLNFGGKGKELWCEGGEKRFIGDMVLESKDFAQSCCWFTSLVSKGTTLKPVLRFLEKAKAVEVKMIPMSQGSKSSRIVAWTFLTKEERRNVFRV
ncbi:MAG: 23S rRNA (adenine(1618)-N(6))-methyltransferase RlmF [Cyclobacteriaceae bacterium]